jgi:general nucleoside transport system permease protein
LSEPGVTTPAVELPTPLQRMASRVLSARPGGLADALWPVAGLLASLVCLAPLIAIAGASLSAGYRTLFNASFGSSFGLGTMLTFSVPLILVGLGVAVPYRAGLFNIGGEGQLIIGAFTAVVVGTHAGFAARPGGFLLLLLAGAIAGGLVAAVAGALRAWRGVNEVITTIMLNFIALDFVQYWITGRFQDATLSYSASPAINPGYELGHLGGAARIPTSIFVALAVSVVVFGLMAYTRAGWRLRVLGANPSLAQRQGISVPWGYFVALAVGGALAGLGGATEAVGNQSRVGLHFSPGWGFDAVAIALLARGNALAVVPFALFFGFLRNGSGVLETNLAIPGELIGMLSGAPVLIVAAVIGWRSYKQRAGEI